MAFLLRYGTPPADIRSEKRMLKISNAGATDESVTLQLDGQIAGRWVELLQTICAAQLAKGVLVTMDLGNVSFADRDGITLLRSLVDRRVVIRNALPFIAEQIRNKASSSET